MSDKPLCGGVNGTSRRIKHEETIGPVSSMLFHVSDLGKVRLGSINVVDRTDLNVVVRINRCHYELHNRGGL